MLLSNGDAASAVPASAALPGLLPAVHRDGLTLVGGGLANNAAISQAVALGAERVFVLAAGVACAIASPPASPYGHAMHSLTFLIQQQLIRVPPEYVMGQRARRMTTCHHGMVSSGIGDAWLEEFGVLLHMQHRRS